MVLFNLGGPQKEKDIKPFLFNFFMDKNVISAPLPIRYLIAKYISVVRGSGAAKEAYAKLGYKSPLLQNTQAQAHALEQLLEKKIPGVRNITRVFVSMRYWEPTAEDTVDALEEFMPDRIVLLPLYPEYSTVTTYSSLQNFKREVERRQGNLHARWGKELEAKTVNCYPLMKGFVEASAALVKEELAKAPAEARILFSAHGLPEKIVAMGDPYQFQCERTAAAIAAQLDLEKSQWSICYQSRLGSLKWTGPSIREELERAARDKVGVIVYPHSFVSDHVETLVELDMQYKDEAQKLGVPYYARAAVVATHPLFIEGLAELVTEALAGKAQPQICGDKFARCGCREAKAA